MRFKDDVVIITGAARGIGRGIADRFIREGAKVALLDMDGEEVERAAKALGPKAQGVECNVTAWDAVDDAVECVNREMGTPSILISNAGVTRDNLIHKMTVDDWNIVVDTHLKGSFFMCKAVQKFMVKARRGKIVLMSSRAALGNRGQVNYSSVKAGLQGMARALALELGPFNINVNAIAPGHIETDMTRAVADRIGITYSDLKDRSIETNAIKRVGTPEDIAGVATFLCSEDSSYMTGQVLWVAGKPTV